MKTDKITYEAKFGQLTLRDGPENNFVWCGEIDLENDNFLEEIPVYVFTKNQKIANDTAKFVEEIISESNQHKNSCFIYETDFNRTGKNIQY